MTPQRLKKLASPFPPTLRLDAQHAWRQGEDAVLLPIIYDLPRIKSANSDVIFIQIIPPDLPEIAIDSAVDQHEEITVIPVPSPYAELLSRKEKKKNLASLKKKAETGDFRAPKQMQVDRAEVDISFSDPALKPAPPKSKCLSKSVPLLLLSVLALVFFAWIAFR